MNEQIQNQIGELLFLALEHEITDDQIVLLNNLVKNHPEQIRFVVQYLQIHSALKFSNSVAKMREPGAADQTEIDFLTDTFSQMAQYEKTAPAIELPKIEPKPELIQKVVYPPRKKVKMSTSNKITLAACAAMVLFLIYLRFDDRRALSVGRISDGVDTEWLSASGQVAVGSDLYPGPLTLKKGVAEIVMDSGAHVLLEGPVELDLETPSRIYLDKGRLVANIEQSTEDRFVVRTANSTVVDFGTEFGVEANETGLTRTQVFKGEVELRQGSDPLKYGSKLQLEAGQAGSIKRSGELSRVDNDPQMFFTTMPSRYELAVKKSNPSYYWRFDYDQGGLLRNEMASGLSNEDRLYGALGYTNGPNLGKGKNAALHLSGRQEDYAVLRRCTDETDNAEAFSIAMWIRPEKVAVHNRILFIKPNPNETTQSNEPGYGNRSTLNFKGSNQFGFMVVCSDKPTEQMSSGEKDMSTYGVLSSPVQLNTWHHVVATYTDSGRMNLYVDGKLEASRPLPLDVEKIRFDKSDICWCLGSRMWSDAQEKAEKTLQPEFFVGSVDEISQYNRELSPEEVRVLYEAARGS